MNSPRQLFKQIVLIILTLIFICCFYPLGLFLFVYRSFLEFLAKKSDSRLGPALKGLESAFAAKTPYSNPSAVIVARIYLDSPVKTSDLLPILNERIIHARDSQGNLYFPYLRKRVVNKFGYQFWYSVDNFQVSDHVRFLNESCPEQVLKESDMMDLVARLSKLPFDRSRSPWEIISVPNYHRDNDTTLKSALILRFHHCLGDGHSVINFMLRLGKKPQPPQPRISASVSNEGGILEKIRILVEGPYETINFMLSTNVDENSFVRNAAKEWRNSLVPGQTSRIPIPVLKKIVQNMGKEYNVSLTVLMMTLFLQASATLLRKKKVFDGDGNSSPKFVVATPWPLPNHPDGLSNHFTVVHMNVSVDFNDVRQTALNVSREFERIRSSILPQFSSLMLEIMMSLPTQLVIQCNTIFRSTAIFSNFPGPLKAFDICGSNVLDLFGGTSPGAPCAVASLVQSYNGTARYIMGGDECNMIKEDAEMMVGIFEQILKELGQLCDSQHDAKLTSIAE
ncbi:unnamed protein product [Orchesella dallaii]|uniref:Diacylglycerol O-acyltransferase n=1 Tax=Orchesella dallaii TaxID=48710 RepID=A0ABP1QZP6_9HEXA